MLYVIAESLWASDSGVGLLPTERDPLVQVSEHKHHNKAVTLSKSNSLRGLLNVVTCMTWQTSRPEIQTTTSTQMMADTENSSQCRSLVVISSSEVGCVQLNCGILYHIQYHIYYSLIHVTL